MNGLAASGSIHQAHGSVRNSTAVFYPFAGLTVRVVRNRRAAGPSQPPAGRSQPLSASAMVWAF